MPSFGIAAELDETRLTARVQLSPQRYASVGVGVGSAGEESAAAILAAARTRHSPCHVSAGRRAQRPLREAPLGADKSCPQLMWLAAQHKCFRTTRWR
jgi:hypothetical protein